MNNLNLQLTTEQMFSLRKIEWQLASFKPTELELHAMVIELIRQNMMKDNAVRSMAKSQMMFPLESLG